MPSRTFASNKSSLFADSGSNELGGGADDHLPVGGPWSGYYFRSAIRFALDFSGMKSISSAVLRLRTSTQTHVGFSSDPDIIVSRCTGDWSANSSSESWGTSPTVWPGPSTTSTGQVTKDIPTSESTDVDIDITAIVRAWAPASVAGGGAAPNYGIRLAYAASGDITEFYSYRHGTASVRPEIIVTYAVDTAPAATMTGPTGAVGTTRPTLTGTASDPEGDPLTNVRLEVLNASAAVVYAADLGAIPSGAFAHVPTSDLPGGALTARATATAGGLTSPVSASVAFTVDRPPVVGAFSSPPASGSNRRPVITFAYSDPDGNVADYWDLEVYATSGGVATGSPVYATSSAGSFASPVSHTPTVDLPGGNLVVRARVRSGPAFLWSAWSGYHAFLIALTSPSVTWLAPASPGAYVAPNLNVLQDLTRALATIPAVVTFDYRPPAGQTITNLKMWSGPGNADPTGGAPIYNGPVGGGGLGEVIYWDVPGPAVSGSFSFGVEVTASGGGITKTWRAGKWSWLDWVGRIFLGDNVTALSAALAEVGGIKYGWLRAELADGNYNVWHPVTDLGTILQELPATSAWLGLRSRFAYLTNDADAVYNGSFEIGPTGLDGWRLSTPDGQGRFYCQPDANVVDGANMAILSGPCPANWLTAVNDGAVAMQPVIAGATYTLSASMRGEGSSPHPVWVRLHQYGPTFGYIGPATPYLSWAAGESQSVWTRKSIAYVPPAGVAYVAAEMAIPAVGADPNEYKCFDAIRLDGPKPGGGGLDKWTVDWTSAG